MASIKKYKLMDHSFEEESIDDQYLSKEVCHQLIKDYLVALRTNSRQWSASTKTRAEVSHSGQKPHPQKGTGRARQGYLGAPQYKGGGRVFGPRPKFDQFVRINRRERRAAIRYLLSEKIKNAQVHILDAKGMANPKTKLVSEFLKRLEIEGTRILFVDKISSSPDSPENAAQNFFQKSTKNIPKTNYKDLRNISGYDLALSRNIVLMIGALNEFKALLGCEE